MKKIIFVLIYLVAILANAQNQKISEMTPAVSIGGSDYFPILQGGANKKGTIAQLPVGGDASGTILNVTVNKLKGYTYSTTAPSNHQLYAFNTSTLQFEPVSVSTLESDPQFTSLGVLRTLTIAINGVSQDLSASRSWTISVPNADKGDITVSGSGDNWQIDPNAVGTTEINNGAVTNVKLANSVIAFQTGTGGTAPTWSASPISLGGQATLNIPLASSTGVTSGTISKIDYDKIAAAYGWGNHAVMGYLTGVTWSMIPDAPAFLTSYTETDPLAVKLAGTYYKPTWLTGIDYSIIDNAPVIPDFIPYKAGANIIFSAGSGDTIVISAPGTGGGGGSLVTVGLSAPGGMSGGSAVTGAGGTLSLTMTLPAGNIRSNGSGSFVIGPINAATEITGVLPAANGGVSDGDKDDITISSTGTNYQIDANAVGSTEIANGSVANADLVNSTVGHTIGTTGTAPGYSASTTALGASTQLNIPMALTTGVTAGLLSKTDYDHFNTAYGWGDHASAGYSTLSPPFSDANTIIKNNATPSKLLKLSAANISASTTRTLSAQDADYTIAGLDIVQTFTARPEFADGIKVQSGSPIWDDIFYNYININDGANNMTISAVSGIDIGVNGEYINFRDSTFRMNQLKGALGVPQGTTAQRPNGSGSNGDIRYNTSTQKFEFKQANVWINIPSAIGGGTVTQVTASEPASTAINLEVTNQTTTPNVVLTYNGTVGQYINGAGALVTFPSSSISDTDKGDITTSSGGTVWTVDNGAISNAKLANSSIGFTCGNTGTAPAWSVPTPSLGGTTQLNIPMAQNASVTGGLISKTQYDKFNGAVTNVSSVVETGGYFKGAKVETGSGTGILTFYAATAIDPGFMTASTQTFGGNKTFNGNVTANTLTAKKLIGSGSAPSVVDGGNDYFAEVVGTDVAGRVAIISPTSPGGANELIITINFATSYTTAPYVLISPGNAAAAELTGGTAIFVPAAGQTNGVTTTGFKFVSGATAMDANEEYVYTYHVIQ